jgi:hypothetical protein
MTYSFETEIATISDENLVQLFTTYWGYYMFLNKKQNVENEKEESNMF